MIFELSHTFCYLLIIKSYMLRFFCLNNYKVTFRDIELNFQCSKLSKKLKKKQTIYYFIFNSKFCFTN